MTRRTLVVAEAGVNHNGELELALRLVDAAADAGADVVKFQTFKAESLATAAAAKADYQVANTREGGSQVDMLRRLELAPKDHEALLVRCRERGIRLMSTAFDAESLAFVATLGMPAIKIPSGDITCGPLLLQAARLRRPLIVSTGMATLADIEQALGVIAFGLVSDAEPRGRADFDSAYASVDGREALARARHASALRDAIPRTSRGGQPARDEHDGGGLRAAGRLFGSHRRHRGLARCGSRSARR